MEAGPGDAGVVADGETLLEAGESPVSRPGTTCGARLHRSPDRIGTSSDGQYMLGEFGARRRQRSAAAVGEGVLGLWRRGRGKSLTLKGSAYKQRDEVGG